MKLQDLALSRYHFCARETLKNDEDFLWKKFESLLLETVKKIGGLENTSQKSIERKTSKSGYFVPIITSRESSKKDDESGIVFYNEFYRTLNSGIFLDVYILQEWIGLAEQITDVSQLLNVSEKLKPQIWDYAKLESELPTECFCYFTEFPESASETKEIFTKLLETENFLAVELDYAHFAICFADEKAVAVIISKNFAEAKAKNKATKLFDELLREYFLSYAKVVFETKNIKSLNAKPARQILLEYLDWFEENQPKSLSEVESANRDLTKYRVDLAEKIKAIEVHLHTIEINIGNAEKILDNPLLQQKKDDLRRMLIKPLEFQAEQIKVDLTYLNIYEEKARIIGEEIANLSNLQAGIYGRKLAWLFGTLTLIGALQLFPEFQNWQLLWAKIAILAAIVFTPILILFGRDIKDKFSDSSKDKFQPTENKQIAEQNARGELPPMSAQDEIVQMTKEKKTENK